MNEIITRIKGGLGNQMFQYAAGRRLAHLRHVDLKLDLSWFESCGLRTYSLGNFNIRENIACAEEIAALKAANPGIAGRVARQVFRRPPKRAKTHIREKLSFHFDPDILSLPDGVYLDGYWQSEKYFGDIAEIIRREFTVRTQQTGKNKELAEIIAATESVSLHIRRGDYASKASVSKILGVCSLDYYTRCVEHVTKTVKNPHFFVFSDEPESARDNLKQPYPTTFVDHNAPDKGYEDLRLMSQCRHHIIANSTFSWWGAWLNPRKDKMVFAPKSWHAGKKFDTTDLIPDEWTRIRRIS